MLSALSVLYTNTLIYIYIRRGPDEGPFQARIGLQRPAAQERPRVITAVIIITMITISVITLILRMALFILIVFIIYIIYICTIYILYDV